MCADLILPIDHWVSHGLRWQRRERRKSEWERENMSTQRVFICAEFSLSCSSAYIIWSPSECKWKFSQREGGLLYGNEKRHIDQVMRFYLILFSLFSFLFTFLFSEFFSLYHIHTRRTIRPCSCFTPEGVLYWSRAVFILFYSTFLPSFTDTFSLNLSFQFLLFRPIQQANDFSSSHLSIFFQTHTHIHIVNGLVDESREKKKKKM